MAISTRLNPYEPPADPASDPVIDPAVSGVVPAAIPALPASRAWLLVGGATMTMAVSYFDRQTLTALAPTLSGALKLTNQDFGWLVSGFSFAYMVGTPVAGRIVDRIGARRALLGAVLLWTVAAALHSLVWSFVTLLLLRVALGLAESPSFPGATQTIHRALPPASRARGIGFLFTGSSIGAFLAPFAAITLNQYYGWRVAFLVTAVAGLIWIPVWLYMTRGAKVQAVMDAPARQAGDAPASTERVSLVSLLRHRAVLKAAIVVLTTSPLIGFVLFWSAKYLNAAEGIHQNDLPRYLWLAPILFDLGAIGFGHLSSSYTEKFGGFSRPLFLCCGLLACVLPLMLVVRGPWVAVALAGIAIAGVAGLFVMFTADMIGQVPARAVGTAASLTATTQSIAFVISSPLIGLVVDRTHSYTLPIIVLSALALPGVLVYLLWRHPGSASAEL